MAAAVAERCKRVKIALLGQLLPLNNPVRVAEEIGMLDNLTGGRLVVAFMRGVLSEDQVYDLNPAEGRAKLIEGMDLVIKALTEPSHFPGRAVTTGTAPFRYGPGRCSGPCLR